MRMRRDPWFQYWWQEDAWRVTKSEASRWREVVRGLLFELAEKAVADGRMGKGRLSFDEEWDDIDGSITWKMRSVVEHRKHWWWRTKGNGGDYKQVYVYQVDFRCVGSYLTGTGPGRLIFDIRSGDRVSTRIEGEVTSSFDVEKALREALLVKAYEAGPEVVRRPLYPG